MALGPTAPYISRMSTSETYPYALEIQPCDKRPGQFWWTIRERGRLLERAKSSAPTREEADQALSSQSQPAATTGSASRASLS